MMGNADANGIVDLSPLRTFLPLSPTVVMMDLAESPRRDCRAGALQTLRGFSTRVVMSPAKAWAMSGDSWLKSSRSLMGGMMGGLAATWLRRTRTLEGDREGDLLLLLRSAGESMDSSSSSQETSKILEASGVGDLDLARVTNAFQLARALTYASGNGSAATIWARVVGLGDLPPTPPPLLGTTPPATPPLLLLLLEEVLGPPPTPPVLVTCVTSEEQSLPLSRMVSREAAVEISEEEEAAVDTAGALLTVEGGKSCLTAVA
jgi:hypothetical protein